MTLKEIITSVVSLTPSRLATSELVQLCHRLAIVYLRKKARTGSLKPDLFGMPLEDIAFDCIADLFNRNENGCFVELQKYYSTLDYTNLDEDQLLSVSRRLVFSKVTQDLHRQYHQLDPVLHRILRNVKEAATSMPDINAERRNDEWWIFFCKERRETSLPVMPAEILESHLSSAVSDGMRTRQILTSVACIFADQSIYRDSYPLFGLALALRSVFARLGEVSTEVVEDRHGLADKEIEQRIKESVSTVSQSMKQKYVAKGKIDEITYQSYFRAIEDILQTEFVGQDGQNGSYIEHLSRQIADLTAESYRVTHRVYLEYLATLTRKRFLDEMRKEL